MTVSLKRLVEKLNERSRRALESAAGLCLSRTHYAVDVEHWLMTLFDDPSLDVTRICQRSEADLSRLQRDIQDRVAVLKTGNSKTPSLAPDLLHLLEVAWLIASIEYDVTRIRSGHVLIAAVEGAAVRSRLVTGASEWARLDPRVIRERFDEYVTGSVETDERHQSGPTERPVGQARLFICYRREDWTSAGRIYDYMEREFGAANVFRDFDSIALGEDWTRAIDQRLTSCNAVIAIVGKAWGSRGGLRQLQQPDDYVRYELALASTTNIPVIPLFVDNAKMPKPADLPELLQPFTRRQGIQVLDSNFQEVMAKVAGQLRRLASAAPTGLQGV